MEKLKVKEKLSNYLEALSFDIEARRNIITYMLENGYDVSSKSFKDYQKEYTECVAKYEIAKREIQKLVIEKAKTKKVNWRLDYETREISYEKV